MTLDNDISAHSSWWFRASCEDLWHHETQSLPEYFNLVVSAKRLRLVQTWDYKKLEMLCMEESPRSTTSISNLVRNYRNSLGAAVLSKEGFTE